MTAIYNIIDNIHSDNKVSFVTKRAHYQYYMRC